MSRELCNFCHSSEKGKLLSCINCNKNACKSCIPQDLERRICVVCVRAEIRDQLIEENIERCQALEQVIGSLRDSAQNYQLEIERFNDVQFSIEKRTRASEISHLERINNLQASIQKAKINIIPYSTIDNLEKAVEDAKAGENMNNSKYQEILNTIETKEIEYQTLLGEEKIHQSRIGELKSASANRVPYCTIRSACPECLHAIKVRFGELIKAGNSNSDSILQSVINAYNQEFEQDSTTVGSDKKGIVSESLASRLSMTGSSRNKKTKIDACHCRIF